MTAPAAKRAPARAWRWPAFALFLIVGPMAGLGVMVAVASDDPSFATEANYYQKAQAWDDAMAQAAENARLGWRIEVLPLTAATEGGLAVGLRDAAGEPIEGAEIAVEAFPNDRAAQIVHAEFAAEGGGRYLARLTLERAGLWELRFVVRARGERFTQVSRADVRAPEEAP